MTIIPTEPNTARADAAAEVAKVNPGSPLVKPWWAQGVNLVSIGGLCTAIAAQLPQVVALFPAGSKAASWLTSIGVIAGCLGTILGQRATVTAAADIHATMDRRKTPRSA